MSENKHTDLISQIQHQYPSKNDTPCLKILADSVGHLQKRLIIQKVEKHCNSD
jgi:hypothetical protein